jgi:hypothetical protein
LVLLFVLILVTPCNIIHLSYTSLFGRRFPWFYTSPPTFGIYPGKPSTLDSQGLPDTLPFEMSALEEPNPDLGPHPVVHHHHDHDTIEKKNISEIEQAHDGDLDKGDHTRYDKVDKELAQYINSEAVEISAAENTRLRRMIDKRVLAIMITTYFLQAIDKGTLSFAAIMGIQADTGLVGPQYSWLTTCIYITILIVEYPQNYIIARVPVAKYLSIMIICWGAVLAGTAACHNFTGMVVVRTLLGLFESACQPAFVVLSSIWYKREEQASRVTYWV